MRRINVLLFLFPIGLYVQSISYAAPLINSVQLDLESSELRISGSGFGNGPEVVIFDNFENGVDGEPVSYQKATYGTWSGNGWYDGVAKYIREGDGNFVMSARDTDYSLSSMNRISQLEAKFDKATKVFISFAVKVPSGTTFAGASSTKQFPSVSSWKYTWALAGDNAFQDSSALDLTLPTHVGSGSHTLGGNDGNITWLNKGDGWFSWDTFNNMSIAVDLSQSDKINYFWRNVSDRSHYKSEGVASKSDFSASQFFIDRVAFPGWWGNGDNNNFNGVYDNIYVATGDNYLARIEVGNSADASKITNLSVVPAKSWTNNEVVLDIGVIGDLESSFIYIVDSNGAVSNASSTACPKCPQKVDDIVIQ